MEPFPVGQLSSMAWGQEDSKDPMPWHHVPMLPISSSFLQLEVLTNLANETNISTILREFQVCHGHTEATGVSPCHDSGCQHHHGGDGGEPHQEEWAEAMPTPWVAPKNPIM